MEEVLYFNELYDLYNGLLTEKQRELLEDYYNEDLSLSEIAENNLITRQAVRDNLKKGEKKLFEYEEKLGIMKKNIIQEEQIANILAQIAKITSKDSDKEIARVLEDVKNKLNCLV